MRLAGFELAKSVGLALGHILALIRNQNWRLNCTASAVTRSSNQIANSVGGSMERRAAIRFLLRAPVIIRWTDRSGAKREDIGRTRDISTAGAFLTCNAPLRV